MAKYTMRTEFRGVLVAEIEAESDWEANAVMNKLLDSVFVEGRILHRRVSVANRKLESHESPHDERLLDWKL